MRDWYGVPAHREQSVKLYTLYGGSLRLFAEGNIVRASGTNIHVRGKRSRVQRGPFLPVPNVVYHDNKGLVSMDTRVHESALAISHYPVIMAPRIREIRLFEKWSDCPTADKAEFGCFYYIKRNPEFFLMSREDLPNPKFYKGEFTGAQKEAFKLSIKKAMNLGINSVKPEWVTS